MTTRYTSTGLTDSGYNATDCLLRFDTTEGPVEIKMPIETVAETVFDIQTLLRAAYKEARGAPPVPAGQEAEQPARSIQVLHDPASGDQVLRVTFRDGTGIGIRLDRRIVADAVQALQSPR